LKFTGMLKKNHEFRRLYSKGKTAASHNIALYYRKNGTSFNRLGITVSTKIGNAVQRNYIRRRLKEIYRLNEHKLCAGYDMVIVARHRSRYAGYYDLEHDFLTLCKKGFMVKKNEESSNSACDIL